MDAVVWLVCVAGVVEQAWLKLLVARPARCARAVEPARWSGWSALRVDDEGGYEDGDECIWCVASTRMACAS